MSGKTSSTNAKNWFLKHRVISALLIVFLLVAIGSSSGNNKKVDLGATSTPASDASQKAAAAKAYNQQPVKAPQPPAPKVYTGTGDDVIDIVKPGDGAAIVKFECPGCTENTVLKTNGAESLLVNTIGTYSGSHLIDVGSGSNTTQATINASGSWTLTVTGLDQATKATDQAFSGQGDSVLYITGSTSKAAVTNTGDENFVVKVYPVDGGFADLAVNTIGSYKGTVPLKAPAYVQIESNGSWTVNLK